MLPTDIDINIDENSEIEVLTEEQISIEPSLYKPDLIVRIGDVILMIEFQSTIVGILDKKRFKVYISNYDLKRNIKNRKIIFLVISTAEYSKTAKHKINDWDIFVFPIISFLDIDKREIISNIKEKIKKQEDINDDEIIRLVMTSIMVKGRENIIKQFKEIATLMNEINYKTEKIKESAYGIALMLGNMYFEKDDSIRKKILGDFMTKVDCITEYGEEQYNAGKNDGINTGKIEMIQNLLKDNEISLKSAINKLTSLNCKPEKISKITGLTITEIKSYQNQG